MSRNIRRKFINPYYLSKDINVYENFSSVKPVVENFGYVGVSSSSNESTSISNTSSSTDISTDNTTTNMSSTDNSQHMESTVNTNTQVDSSQTITNVNTTDNTSIQNISSSTDTYNVDNSQTLNTTELNTTNELITSCGLSIQDAQAAVNIMTDESINTNIDASNTFMVTGNNNTISDVRMRSQLSFIGSEVDKSCVIDTMNDLQSDLSSENDNSKSMAGGQGGDVGAEAGGNTTANTNENTKSDAVDAGVDAGQDALQAATTANENTSENANTADVSNEQTTKQSTEQKATAGGLNITIIIILIGLSFYFLDKQKLNLIEINKKYILGFLLILAIFMNN